MRARFTVLSREYCHLCEEMVTALQQLQGRFAFDLEVVDVDSHPELEAEWGDKVPVLLEEGRELCHYHLDRAVLDARLARME